MRSFLCVLTLSHSFIDLGPSDWCEMKSQSSKGSQVKGSMGGTEISVAWGSSGQGFLMGGGRGAGPSILRFLMSLVVTRDLWFMGTTVVEIGFI